MLGERVKIFLIDFNIPKESKIRVGENNSMGISIDPNHQHNMIEIVHPNKIH